MTSFRLRSGMAKLGLLASALVPFGAIPLLAPLGQAPKPAATFDQQVKPFVKKYCTGCHSGATPSGKFAADAANLNAFYASAAKWRSAATQVEKLAMPPKGMTSPKASERAAFIKAVRGLLANAPKTAPSSDPGRVTMRRLNRAEYNNTVRELFYGMPFSPADDFPNDDVGYGFDNIGDVLTLSPLLMEKYLDAAESLARQAIALPRNQTRRFDSDQLSTDTGNALANSIGLYSAGRVWADVKKLAAGSYKIRVHAFAQQAGPDLAKVAIFVGQRRLGVLDVAAVGEPKTYELPPESLEGDVRIAAAFVNDFYNPNDPNPRNRDRNLYISAIELIGPINKAQALPFAHSKLLFVKPDPADPLPAARQILGEFARRAYRRPPTKEEVDKLVRFVELARKDGEPFERGIQLGVTAALVSPNFLFRVEPGVASTGSARTLNGFEVASRLSYFLWSSMPDEKLFSLAKSGELLKPAVLEAEVGRMLKDPRAQELAKNFAGQWLNLRKLENASPDPELFPEFNDRLRESMRLESEAFFNYIVAEDRPVSEFIDSDFAFVNEPLAKLYGLDGVEGTAIRKVRLNSKRRGGILMQASVLTVTSNPNRTSPVKRGKWVLDQILGEPPPPPPPDVGALEDDTAKISTKTIKQRMERHRRDPACAVCHRKMDGIGLAFENYDAIGRWRTKDGAFPVETEGEWEGGRKFANAQELKKMLMERKPQFVRALTEKLMIYALGRGLKPSDEASIDKIAANSAKNGDRFSSIVKGIVLSDPFLKRTVERG